jgi:hypothetical protein
MPPKTPKKKPPTYPPFSAKVYSELKYCISVEVLNLLSWPDMNALKQEQEAFTYYHGKKGIAAQYKKLLFGQTF